jgi:hypothetical protein
MCWKIQYPKKKFKIGKLLHCINGNRKHTIGRKTNQKRSRPGSGIECHAIFNGNGGDNTWNRRTHQIIGYADDWIIHTTHKHEQVSVVKLQKAMDKIVWECLQFAALRTLYAKQVYPQSPI